MKIDGIEVINLRYESAVFGVAPPHPQVIVA